MKKYALLGLFAVCAFGQAQTRLDVMTDRMELKALNSYQFFKVVNSGNAYNDPALIPNLGGWGVLGTPSNYLYEVHTQTLFQVSDERRKKDILDMPSGVLEKLKNVRTVSYRLKGTNGKGEGKAEIGFLAQNLAQSFPELVAYDAQADVYEVDYTRTVTVLVAALKEQQKVVDQQAEEIKAIKKKLGM